MQTKNIFFVIGESGSGKDFIVDRVCEKYHMNKILSYTTRPKRPHESNTHTFISNDKFKAIKSDIVAYTLYNGNEYGTTQSQVDDKNNNFYIINPYGLDYFYNDYKGKRPYYIIYITAPEATRKVRMYHRGDNKLNTAKRIANDKIEFAGISLDADIILQNEQGTDIDKLADKIYKFIEIKEGIVCG
mgnify:FL=1|jgi:guanylate kinase